ncbi:unnamed protein product [Cuscuta epithymum]|nr:unnamed protein product [Cuscuta epithymum]
MAKGESFYNPYIPGVIEELTHKGLVKESAGARAIFIEGYCVPLIVVKRDGGYNYASTDLVSLCLNEEKADWIIYVTDSSQEQHFTMIFKVCPCFYGQPNMQVGSRLLIICTQKSLMWLLAFIKGRMESAFRLVKLMSFY